MHLVFFDESKNDASNPFYYICGVCIHTDNLRSIEQKINDLADEVFGEHHLKKETEFHACDIYHRNKQFKRMMNPCERVSIITKLLEIASLNEVHQIQVRIDTDKSPKTIPAQDIAFMYFCERCNTFMKAEKSLALLIGDRESDRQSEIFSTNLSRYRITGTDFAHGIDIENIFESVHFTHSHLSRFLQLADAYTWAVQFQKRHQSTSNPHIAKLLKSWKDNEQISFFPTKYKYWPKP